MLINFHHYWFFAMRFIFLTFFLFLIAIKPACSLEENAEKLIIENHKGRHVFMVEFADTARKRQYGLMFRTTLAENTGMLFDFKKTEPVSLWMKNTFISLDILFIDSKGHIAFIAEKQPPLSLAPIKSSVPVRAALEIPAGTVEKHAIKTGDLILHPMFDNF